MDNKVTFRTGQVWRNKSKFPGITFTISSFSGGTAYAVSSDTKKSGGFAYVDKNGNGTLDNGWELLDDPGNKNEWRSWRNNRPGECVCGMLKSLCVYHK